jgi:hypothetical protein
LLSESRAALLGRPSPEACEEETEADIRCQNSDVPIRVLQSSNDQNMRQSGNKLPTRKNQHRKSGANPAEMKAIEIEQLYRAHAAAADGDFHPKT